MEILIYRLVRSGADTKVILFIACLQLATLLAAASFLQAIDKKSVAHRSREIIDSTAWRSEGVLIGWLPGLAVVLAPLALLLFGVCDGVVPGVREFIRLGGPTSDLAELFFNSAIVAFLTGTLTATALLVLAYSPPSGRTRRFLIGFAAPSSVLIGLSLLIIWRAIGLATLIKISVGLTLTLVPALYRLQWDGLLQSLSGQIRIADSLGASPALIFTRILIPQVAKTLGVLSGLAALWAWGDFALSHVIAEGPVTLALTAQSLLNSYHLNAATIYVRTDRDRWWSNL